MLTSLLAAMPGLWTEALGGDSAAVVMYHRFGESQYPSTNITIEQFEAHLEELRNGEYAVLPLDEIVAKLKGGLALPERAVAITIDDAYRSVLTQALPRLKEAGFPFTLFVATDAVDSRLKNILNWDEVREIEAGGGYIGHHGASHPHMPRNSAERNKEDIERASRRFIKELGKRPGLFAYPYGESSLELEKMAREAGFDAALGQHSGAMGPSTNLYYLPRFAMNEKYGDIARFRLAVNTMELPVLDITPIDSLIGDDNPPAIGFTVGPGQKGLDRLTCFTSHAGEARIDRLGDSRIEVRIDEPFPRGRTRLNCTIPGDGGRWHWLGRQFFLP
ncbi:MAG: polysaccharide deacetylase family protein [Rhodospirillales bacterium]